MSIMIDLEAMGLERFQASAGDAAGLLKALSNENRLMILCQIGEGERQVSDLQLGLSPVSYTHLTLPTICSV